MGRADDVTAIKTKMPGRRMCKSLHTTSILLVNKIGICFTDAEKFISFFYSGCCLVIFVFSPDYRVSNKAPISVKSLSVVSYVAKMPSEAASKGISRNAITLPDF